MQEGGRARKVCPAHWLQKYKSVYAGGQEKWDEDRLETGRGKGC